MQQWGAVGGVMASTLNTGLLSGSSGIGTGWEIFQVVK